MRGRALRSCTAAVVACALGVTVFAGCGDDEDDAAGAGAAAPAATPSGDIDVKPRTIGLTAIVLTAGSSQRLLAAAKEAAGTLGWKVLECDGAGNPRKADTCVSSLVQQGAEAVLTAGMEPSLLRKSLARAKSEDVPVINIGGSVSEPDAFAGSYAPDDHEFSRVLTERMLADIGDEATVGAYVNDAFVAIRSRTETLRELVAQKPGVEVVEMSTANYTDPFASSRQAAQSLLRSNPDAAALWGTGTTNVPGAVAAVASLNKQSQVKVYGFYIDESLIALIKQGKVAAVADAALDQNSYTAIDQLLGLWEADEPIDPDAEPVPMTYTLYTQENVAEAEEPPGYPAEFQRRWAEKY